MNIVVCIKQVPILSEIQVDLKKGAVIRDGARTVINPEDTNAIEEAIKLRREYGGKVTAISMGPSGVRIALKEALAMGVDEIVMISDPCLACSDTQITAKILAAAIKKLGHFDMCICGAQTLDGNTALVGPQIAEYLDIPQITYVKKIDILDGGKARVKRFTETEDYIYECNLPALFTVTKEINDPRLPTMIGIYDAYGNENHTLWDVSDLGFDAESVGIEGSPTEVVKTFRPKRILNVEFIKGKNGWEKADILIDKMIESKLI